MKPRVKCYFRGLSSVRGMQYIAMVGRLSNHPKLGPPRTESTTQTSLVLRIDFVKKELETLNTIYWWE